MHAYMHNNNYIVVNGAKLKNVYICMDMGVSVLKSGRGIADA